MRIIFHIGTNKTGTSAIQAFLHRNPEFLRHNGIIYPLTGRTNGEPNHHAIAIAPVESLASIVSDIEQEAENNGVDTVILSSEMFHTVSPVDILDAFSNHEISTISFVRDHVSYLSSWYREEIKSYARVWSFPEFIEELDAPYSAWAEAWPNHTMYQYNRTKLLNGSVVDHFIRSVSPYATFLEHSYDENPSISGNLLFVKQVVNNIIPHESIPQIHFEMFHLATLDPTFSGSMYISEELCEVINTKYADDRVWINHTYGVDLAAVSNVHTGSRSPDIDRLEEDIAKIISFSEENSFLFSTFMTSHNVCTLMQNAV